MPDEFLIERENAYGNWLLDYVIPTFDEAVRLYIVVTSSYPYSNVRIMKNNVLLGERYEQT